MSWAVTPTEEFEAWFKAQAKPAQAKLDTWIVVLLLGGDKTGDERWHEAHVPKADALYEAHLEELRRKERDK